MPQIAKVHQFAVTRMERYVVSCHAAGDKAHFQPHRDNTTKGTARRRNAFWPFLHDDAAAKIREANNPYLGEGVEAYKTTA